MAEDSDDSSVLPASIQTEIDEICDLFEDAWLASGSPHIGSYLHARHTEWHRPLLAELLRIDLDYRRRQGQPVNVGVYIAELPEFAHMVESLFPLVSDTQSASALQTTGPGTDIPSFTTQMGVGATLGNYRLLERIGEGGMGQVYKAMHTKMDRVVAVKVLHSLLTSSPDAVARFEREVRTAARLAHRNIVTAYDAAEANGVHFLVMEYVDGPNLSYLIREKGPLSVPMALDCIAQAAQGLAFAHGQGVIHRDIKPSNLLLDRTGAVKVADLGLVKLETTFGRAGLNNTADSLTTSQQIMGTFDFMSPEQASDPHRADARSDVYSLGCTLFYLLTGRPVFTSATAARSLIAHREQEPPSPCDVRAEIPPHVDALFRKMVAKVPADRFQSMNETIQAITAIQNTIGPSAEAKKLRASAFRRNQSSYATWIQADSVRLALAFSLTALFVALFINHAFHRPTEDGWDVEKLVAHHVLELGGTIEVQRGDHRVSVASLDALSGESSRLVGVRFDKPTPKLKLDALLRARNVDTVRLLNAGVTSRGLSRLTKWPGLRCLDLNGREIDDDFRFTLGRLHSIEDLALWNTMIGDLTLEEVSLLTRLQLLNIGRTRVTDSGVRLLARLPKLRELELSGTTITGRSLKALHACPELTKLVLFETRLIDDDMIEVEGFPQLRDIGLHSSKFITDKACEHLAKATLLESLGLNATQISDIGTRRLETLPRLLYLGIADTAVTDDGLESISKVQTLERLEMFGVKASSRGIQSLTRLPKLRSLWWDKMTDEAVQHLGGKESLTVLVLNDSPMTDKSLDVLKTLKNLASCQLHRTGITKTGVESLRDALPLCAIEWTPAPKSKE